MAPLLPATRTKNHVPSVDTIRFISAIWVFWAHCGVPPLPNPFDEGSSLFKAFRFFYESFWSAPAAVIAFFVISGFCIHHPYVAEGSFKILPFYSRRYIRLLIPVLIVIPLGHFAGLRLTLFQDSILWSVLAEMIYYGLYPLLRQIRACFDSWLWMVVGAFAASFAIVAIVDPAATRYPAFGPSLNWAIGLPCWMLGCMVAEYVSAGSAGKKKPAFSIWTWRILVLSAMWACSVITHLSPVGPPWVLNAFSILVALWLVEEIAQHDSSPSDGIMKAGSECSYSLYLIHMPAFILIQRHLALNVTHWTGWLAMQALVFAACYLFYRLIERPSHWLARRISRPGLSPA